MNQEALSFYASSASLSDISTHKKKLSVLTKDIHFLVELLHKSCPHIFWTDRMGGQLSEERKREVQIRSVESKLKKLFALERNFTIEERPLHKKLVCNCRDFSLLLCAFLRYQGIPARARCGFATYFIKDKYEDHWVCEYWQSKAQRWVMVDAHLDEFQQQVLQIDFVPLGKFIPAGQAW